MKRLGYRKSRNGCLHCKQRRVKCDEVQPVCGACEKHKVNCNLVSFVPHHRGSPVTRSTIPWSPSVSPLGNVGPAPATKASEASQSQSATDSIPDAALIHHWTVSTCQTITKCPQIQEVMQKDVPREAFRHKFLFHQLLVFTGYHIAYLNPEQRATYHLRCTQHQEQALSGLRQILPDATTDANCHAVYLTSVFLALRAFSSFPAYDCFNKSSSLIGILMEILTLLSGIKSILESGKHFLHRGPFKVLSGGTIGKKTSRDISAVEEVMQAIIVIDERIREPETELEFSDEHGIQHLRRGILQLASTIEGCVATKGNASTAEYMAAIVWPMMLSSETISWLRSESPTALLLLAYYASVLSIASNEFWFFGGWGEALAEYIRKRLEGAQWAQLLPNCILVDHL